MQEKNTEAGIEANRIRRQTGQLPTQACKEGASPPQLSDVVTKTLSRKTVQENADEYLLTKQYFLRAHNEEIRQ
jgi:hypothetical protein